MSKIHICYALKQFGIMLRFKTMSAEYPSQSQEIILRWGESKGFARDFKTEADRLLGDRLSKTLKPSYYAREAVVSHRDPKKYLVGSYHEPSKTDFTVEDYPLVGTPNDRYLFIRW